MWRNMRVAALNVKNNYKTIEKKKKRKKKKNSKDELKRFWVGLDSGTK